MKGLRHVLLFSIVIFIIGSSSSAFGLEGTYLISNSERWEDVYSTMLFSNLVGISANFLTSTAHGSVLLNGISTDNEIGLISSEEGQFIFGYDRVIESSEYKGVEELIVDDANLELIEEDNLDEITNFIIVDSSYGYGAIAVAPYAVLTNSWVFLADRTNIAEIESIMQGREVDEVLVYGYVERSVQDAMEQFNPKIIDNGDRFKDNIEIVEEFIKIKDSTQVLLSNGEFIEKEVLAGKHPVLFTGRDNVPEDIAEYLQNSDITIGVLIGNELINAATNIRRTTGLSVMVKFAQGSRARTAGVSAVEGLDLFYLPTPTVILGIHEIKYNRASTQIEVTYHSESNVPMYFQGTLTALSAAGTERVGDLDPIFIAPSDYKTIIYPEVTLEGDDIRAEVFTLFGEVATSLDRRLEGSFDMQSISVLDNCEIEATKVTYIRSKESIYATIHNVGEVDCYVDLEFEEFSINDVSQTIGSEGSQLVKAGKKKKVIIPQRLDDLDIEENTFTTLVAYYGQREDTLVKVFRGKFELNTARYLPTTYLIIVLIFLILGILLFLWKMRRDKEW